MPPAPGRPFALLTTTGERLAAVAADDVMALFRQHGALLLRGFGADLAAFSAFTGQFCAASVFNESPDRQMLDPAANVQSVNGGSDAFPLHPELSREPWKPDVAFFACLSPPRAGGETTVCDGVDLVRRLDLAVRSALAARRLVYVQPAPPEMLEFWLGTTTPTDAQRAAPPDWCPYSFPPIGGRIARVFSRPALHRPMFSDEPAFGNFLLFARDYLGRSDFPLLDDGRVVPEPWLQAVRNAAAPITIAVQWQQGDVLMLDNSRFMHGRRAILDTNERLIASHFGYLRDAPVNREEPANPLWRRGGFRPPVRRVSAL